MACNSNISKMWCPILTDNNIWVVDNSSAFRMQENISLIIPEINSHLITENTKLISNPNCSTAQLVMV
jgi:aspartate-semialdehyde dehydrogenase